MTTKKTAKISAKRKTAKPRKPKARKLQDMGVLTAYDNDVRASEDLEPLPEAAVLGIWPGGEIPSCGGYLNDHYITTAEEARVLDEKLVNDAAALPMWNDNFYRPEKRISPKAGSCLNRWIIGAVVFGLCFWYGAFKFIPFVYHLLLGK